MHIALRPYMTTGIAIVGASVIAVAPVTVSPPDLPAVEVAAVDAVRSVTADVELTAFVDGLIAAFPEAGQRIVEFVTQTLPASVEGLVAARQFAHVFAFAVEAATMWPTVPLQPFIDVFETQLPLPLGTPDGAAAQAYNLTFTLLQVLTDVATEVAQVIDGIDHLGDLPADLISIVTARIQSAVTSLQKIIAAFTGATPFSALAAPASDASGPPAMLSPAADQGMGARGAPDNPNVVAASADSSNPESSPDTATVTVDTSVTADIDTAEDTTSKGTDESEDESEDASQDSTADDVTPNGGAGLSDGNQVESDTATGQEDDDSPTGAEETPTSRTPSDDDTATAARDTDTGSNEGSGDDAGSSQ